MDGAPDIGHDAHVRDNAPNDHRGVRAFTVLLPICLAGLFLALSFVLPAFANMSALARIGLPIFVVLVVGWMMRVTSRDERGAWWRYWW